MNISICTTRTDDKGREILNHGTGMFPVSCYEDRSENMSVPWHWHEELEALVVLEGKIRVSAGKNHYEVSAGEGFFINSEVLHMACETAVQGSRLCSIVFHPRLVGAGIDSVFWQNYVGPVIENPCLEHVYLDLSAPWHQKAIEQIKAAWNAYAKETPGYEFEVRSALSRLIYELSVSNPVLSNRPTEKALRDSRRLKDMLLFIQKHYFEQITVSQIAAAAMISESECMRCFRSTMSTSPIQYLKQYRLQKAAELLTTTESKIVDISMDCGFQDTSYFVKSFREAFQVTPAEFRKRR